MTMAVVSVLFLMTLSVAVSKSIDPVFPLDMAENSVDDSFDGCRDEMNHSVISTYMEREKKSSTFKVLWKRALDMCYKEGGLNINQSAAIFMYTSHSYDDFNAATRNQAEEYKSNNFRFYTLYFFLTDAVQQLKLNQSGCETTYRRTKVKFEKDVLNKTIRFGSFASSSFRKDLIIFGNKSCFEIVTCHGAVLGKYAKLEHEKEVLIPTYETFTVTDIKTKVKVKDLWCEIVYYLKSSGIKSNLNCAIFK